MAAESDVAMVGHLESVITELVEDTNLFRKPPAAKTTSSSDIPSKSVWVYPSGGLAPTAFNGELNVIENPALTIRVRGNPRKYQEGLALARQVRDAAHYAPLTDYIDVRVNESEPIWLGEDDEGHPRWSINVSLNVEGTL